MLIDKFSPSTSKLLFYVLTSIRQIKTLECLSQVQHSKSLCDSCYNYPISGRLVSAQRWGLSLCRANRGKICLTFTFFLAKIAIFNILAQAHAVGRERWGLEGDGEGIPKRDTPNKSREVGRTNNERHSFERSSKTHIILKTILNF